MKKILLFIGMVFCVMALGGAEISAYSPDEMFIISDGKISFNENYEGDCTIIDIPPEING